MTIYNQLYVLLLIIFIMKKSLMMLGAVAMMLASCTNEEVLNVSDSRAIGFNGTGIDNITKADITSPGFNQFYVYGGYGEKAVFNRISVKKSGEWGYTQAQYWVNGIWNFAGYAIGRGEYEETAYDGVTPSWDNAAGTLTLAVNSDATHQDDVIFASSKDIEVTDATTYKTPVTLNFTHLLSKIKFTFTKDAASLGGVTVKLQNFKVAALATNAKWVDGVQGAADAPATGDYTDFVETAEEVNGTSGLSTAEFYVIPQPVSAFAIAADAVITDANNTVIKSGKVTAKVPTTTITEWAAQTKYVYTALLKYENIVTPDPDKDPKPIEFTGSATDWVEGGTTDPVNPDVPTPQP